MDLSRLSPATKALLARLREKALAEKEDGSEGGDLTTCKACGGTGLNSKGGKCWPCAVAKEIAKLANLKKE
jgi:hypothetical protein